LRTRSNEIHNLLRSVQTGSEDEISGDAVPYRRLWQMTLIQAIDEARGIRMQGINPVDRGGQRKAAREWLMTPSSELRLVCDFAGIGMETVVNFARRLR
jgi:hypothetical protein